MKKERLTFIGTGVMGRSMAGHLIAAGYPLFVYNRTPEKARPLLGMGAVWRGSPRAAAAEADVAITMLGYPSDVEATYLGEDGILENMKPGALAIDMTTSSPALAQRVAEAGAARGIGVLDAPVSGGDLGAREARLSIMAGGSEADFQRAKPVFGLLGQTVVHHGPAGSGQHAKMCNQIAIAGGMAAIGEALGYARAAGLGLEAVLQSVSQGAAGSWSMSHLVPRALRGDFEPGFYVKHFVKDMGIALDSAAELGLDLPALALAKRLYDRLVEDGCGDEGTQALFKLFV